MVESFGHNYTPESPWTQFLDALPEEFVMGEGVEEVTEMCDELRIGEGE